MNYGVLGTRGTIMPDFVYQVGCDGNEVRLLGLQALLERFGVGWVGDS